MVGEQHHLVLSQEQRVGHVAERSPGVVGGLVQPRPGGVDGQARPQRVDHLLAVQPTPVGQGEQLHQGRGAAAAPDVIGDGHPVARDGEASEQCDVDVHAGASFVAALWLGKCYRWTAVMPLCQAGRDSRYSTSSVIAADTRRIRLGTSSMSQA